jgi:hypothetical protein
MDPTSRKRSDIVVWYKDRDGTLGLFTNILQLNIDHSFQLLKKQNSYLIIT